MSLLVGVNGTEVVELADFCINLDFFNDGGTPGGNCLDLSVGQCAAFQILCRAIGVPVAKTTPRSSPRSCR